MPIKFYWQSTLVKIQESDEGFRAYFLTEEKTNNDLVFNIFYVYDYTDGSKEATMVGKHILSNFGFPKGNHTLRKGKKVYGNQDDLVTYDEVIALYPDLKDIKQLDYKNRVLPEIFYEAQLKTGAWKGDVTGFESIKYAKNKDGSEAPEERKGKSLLSKLADVSLALEGKKKSYVETEKIEHDWSEDYNGGQDKKNFWFNYHSASNPSNGQVLAVNGKKLKADKYNHQTNGEIVLLAADGSVITRHETTNEVPMELMHKGKGSHQVATEDGNLKLDYLLLAYRQVVDKKMNADGNEQQIVVKAIDGKADVMYEHAYDLPFGKRPRLDTMFNYDNGRTVVLGIGRKPLKDFMLESSPAGQKQLVYELKNQQTRSLYKYFEHQGQPYAIYRNDNSQTNIASDFAIFKLEDGKAIEGQILEADRKNRTVADIEILVNDEELVLVTKQATKGLNDFKFELGLPTFYRLEGSEFKKISNFEDDNRAINASSVSTKMSAVTTDKGHYFLSKNFVPNPQKSGSLLVQNRLTKLTF